MRFGSRYFKACDRVAIHGSLNSYNREVEDREERSIAPNYMNTHESISSLAAISGYTPVSNVLKCLTSNKLSILIPSLQIFSKGSCCGSSRTDKR
jgi:hypothetical protein